MARRAGRAGTVPRMVRFGRLPRHVPGHDQPHAVALPGRRGDQPRRHGRRLSRHRHAAEPRGGAQGPARGSDPRRRPQAPLHPGGASCLRPRAPAHRGHPRRGRGRRLHVHRDGADSRAQAQRRDGAPAPAGRACARARHGDRVRPRPGPREGHRPPRPQAGQRDGHRRGPRQDHRLRHRQAAGAGAGGDQRADRGARRHRAGRGDGHRRVHVPRAGARGDRRSPQRHLLVRHRAARDALRAAAVPGPQRPGDRQRDPAPAGAPAARARPRGPRRRGR